MPAPVARATHPTPGAPLEPELARDWPAGPAEVTSLTCGAGVERERERGRERASERGGCEPGPGRCRRRRRP